MSDANRILEHTLEELGEILMNPNKTDKQTCHDVVVWLALTRMELRKRMQALKSNYFYKAKKEMIEEFLGSVGGEEE